MGQGRRVTRESLNPPQPDTGSSTASHVMAASGLCITIQVGALGGADLMETMHQGPPTVRGEKHLPHLMGVPWSCRKVDLILPGNAAHLVLGHGPALGEPQGTHSVLGGLWVRDEGSFVSL